MCCRYYIGGDNDPDEVLENWLNDAQRRADAMQVQLVRAGEVRPTNVAPVIAPDAKCREPGAFPMKWGFTHSTQNMLIFNTRSETALEKPLFAESAKTRRCLIPASHYFEWKKDGKDKIKYAIKPLEGQLYLAGLYFRLPSEKLPCFSVLTMDAAGELKSIHDRMPVLIPEGKVSDWLSAEQPFEKALLYADCRAEYEIA